MMFLTTYKKDASFIRFAHPATILIVAGAILWLITLLLLYATFSFRNAEFFNLRSQVADAAGTSIVTGILGIWLIARGVALFKTYPKEKKMKLLIQRRLCSSQYGNPLNLKEGEILPTVVVERMDSEIEEFKITIFTNVRSIEQLENVSSQISSSLQDEFKDYAIAKMYADIACNKVVFIASNVSESRQLKITHVGELMSPQVTEIPIQKGLSLDLTSSGSMLFAGKTRSGKTTGVMSVLISALLHGPDEFGSRIVIIDPKKAELSRLPYTYSPGLDGDMLPILNAVQGFSESIVKRQQILNEASEKAGNVVSWWDIGLCPSILFCDEYIAARTLFPKKNGQKNSYYCLETFDNLIKRIVTMGASSGSFVIISIAQASVSEGGLPSMLRDALSTKVLFRPTLEEARLIWDSHQLEVLPLMNFKPGDCWLSSTDGINDSPSFVQFPDITEFDVYRQLGALLKRYYQKKTPADVSVAKKYAGAGVENL